jgi:hypothetical protein
LAAERDELAKKCIQHVRTLANNDGATIGHAIYDTLRRRIAASARYLVDWKQRRIAGTRGDVLQTFHGLIRLNRP